MVKSVLLEWFFFFFLVCNYCLTRHTVVVAGFVVQVTRVQTIDDWRALADLRFNEWIDDGTTSREAFRRATLEIYQQERPNAVLFLATTPVMDDDSIVWGGNPVVAMAGRGAAELSPYELVNAIVTTTTPTPPSIQTTTTTATTTKTTTATIATTPLRIFYVTDVVTDRNFRRQGIAKALLQTLEAHARNVLEAQYLVLHVAPDNLAAIAFYQTLGYQNPPPRDLLNMLQVDIIADNASTYGELLMSKIIGES